VEIRRRKDQAEHVVPVADAVSAAQELLAGA
jgi:hypothetical protein